MAYSCNPASRTRILSAPCCLGVGSSLTTVVLLGHSNKAPLPYPEKAWSPLCNLSHECPASFSKDTGYTLMRVTFPKYKISPFPKKLGSFLVVVLNPFQTPAVQSAFIRLFDCKDNPPSNLYQTFPNISQAGGQLLKTFPRWAWQHSPVISDTQRLSQEGWGTKEGKAEMWKEGRESEINRKAAGYRRSPL